MEPLTLLESIAEVLDRQVVVYYDFRLLLSWCDHVVSCPARARGEKGKEVELLGLIPQNG